MPRVLDDVIRAVCDGTPVDWQALEKLGDSTIRSQLSALRLVANIAELHSIRAGTPLEEAQRPGGRWAHLQVLEPIASGAFGDVYRAWDPQLDREVALKLLRRGPDADGEADEAVDEARLLARLRHPHIVSVYGAARADGRTGLWMEFLRGRTLAQAVKSDGPLPARRVADIGVALCDALAAVHAVGLVHRDIKAQNVMLTNDGRVVLMDFGAGREMRHAGFDVAGTPLYLAPEVALGAPASPLSDLYSLGMLLRFVATGVLETGKDATSRANGLSRRLHAVVARASAPSPEARHASAEELGRALRRVLGHRRRRRLVAGGLAVAGIVAGGIFVGSRLASPTREARFASAWLAAVPGQVPVTAHQHEALELDLLGPLSGSGELVGLRRTADGWTDLISVVPGRDEIVVWTSFGQDSGGRVQTSSLAGDGQSLAYAWVDDRCACASIKVVARRGDARTLVARPELKGAWLSEWRNGLLPALLAPERGPHELALINGATGELRLVARVDRDPHGFSLSPDGRTLAYDAPAHAGAGALRQIVLVDVITGREERLASAHHQESPVWSPDGSWLLFVERGDAIRLRAYRMEGEQIGVPVTLRERVHGLGSYGFLGERTLVYATWAERHLFVAEAGPDGRFDGLASARRIGRGTMPAWSPDGQHLAWVDFSRRRGAVRVRSMSDGQEHEIHGFVGAPVIPRWSRDGRHLAFWGAERLTRSLQTADLRSKTVVEHLRYGAPFYGGEFGLEWGPEGDELLVSPDLREIRAVSRTTGLLRTFYRREGWRVVDYLHVSPDGRSLGFVESRGTESYFRVVPLHADGLNRRVRERDWSLVAGWHADGESYLAIRAPEPLDLNAQDHRELWRVPLDGTKATSLGLKTAGLVYAAMSPDGRYLAYESGRWDYDLWQIEVPGLPQ